MASPAAGKTHDLVLRYGPPGTQTSLGLMLPSLEQYVAQPYTPFSPASRQGFASNKDFNVTAVWEQGADWSAGMGHTVETEVEPTGYGFAQGVDDAVAPTVGPTLFTAKKGAILPPAADSGWIGLGAKQFLQFKGKLYALTSATPGVIYVCSDGTNWSVSDTLTTAGGHLFTDGVSLYCTQQAGSVLDKPCGTGADNAGVGTVAWSDPTNIYTDDANYATAALNTSASHYLFATNFDFSTIPANAVITGIQAKLKRKKSAGAGSLLDTNVKLLIAGAVASTSDNKADVDNNWPTTEASATYGDQRDTWGVGPSAAQVKANNFGFAFSVTGTGAATAAGNLVTASVWYQPRVRKTTDGTSWQYAAGYAADFLTTREEGNLAYVRGAYFYPGKDTNTATSYKSPVLAGLPGTVATNLLWALGSVWIGKPEGLYRWTNGRLDKVRDESAHSDTSNFKILVEHRGFLFYNVRNHLYFATSDPRGDSGKATEIIPEDAGSFVGVDCAAATAGPLLLGARVSVQGVTRAYVYMLWGADEPGLHPLWSDANGANYITAVGASDVFAANSQRVYFSVYGSSDKWLDLNSRFYPNTYHTPSAVDTTHLSYLNLIEFSAGFRTVPKWFYEVVLNVRNPVSTTKAWVFYSVDGGTWTQTLSAAGTADTLILSSRAVGTYLPLNTTGTFIQLRVYLWTTSSSSAAEIMTITLRGMVQVKPRMQFSFPVRCDKEVKARASGGAKGDTGAHILAGLRAAATSGYPVDLQDLEGKWHRCAFRSPYPLEAVRSHALAGGTASSTQTFTVVQCLLVEIDALDASGNLNAWTAG